jgi:hypothetical protein
MLAMLIRIPTRRRVAVRHTTPRWTVWMVVYLEQIIWVTRDKHFESQAMTS